MKVENIEHIVAVGKRIELSDGEAFDVAKIMRYYLHSTLSGSGGGVDLRRNLARQINEALV
ncbi:MAG: hypothetical protein V3V96_06590 [Acidiferrobacterales bacterium]